MLASVRLGTCLLLCAPASGAGPASTAPPAPSIEITALPVWGRSGSLHGRVRGVPFATHRVAVYLHVEGSGWWSKPSAANPTVPIRSDGSFSANVTTGGLDALATIYTVALLGPGVRPPVARGARRVPASLRALATATRERYGRTITFAGRKWAVKEAPVPVGPGPTRFSSSPQDVFVDARGRLHLRLSRRGNAWWGAEVILLENLGHGAYWFTTESQVGELDHNLVFGAFTWDAYGDDPRVPAWPHREIDFEDSRWGVASRTTTSQVVVQPFSVPGNVIRYTTPRLSPPALTRFFVWRPDEVEFVAAKGVRSPCALPAGAVLHRSIYRHDPRARRLVPSVGRERMRFNLWIFRGGGPSDGRPAEVVISDFRFSRIQGVFVGGCGVNPPRSLVATGSASIGRTLHLHLDNPLGSQRPGARALLVVAARPSAGFPCGVLLPGFGMRGPAGELLIAPGPADLALEGLPWQGPGRPAPFALPIPADPGLIGRAVYAQGALLDPSPNAPRPIGLTEGVEVCVGR